MDNQKVVVILLLLTIILSVISVVITVSMQVKPTNSGNNSDLVFEGDPVDSNTANVNFVVTKGGAG